MSICGKCGESYEGNCKPCKRAYDKVYRQQNAAKVAATKQRCQDNKAEQYAARRKAYYEANKAEISEKTKAYRAENWGTIVVRKAKYVNDNREAVTAWRKAHYAANKQRITLRNKRYVEANLDAVRAKRAEYRAKHAEQACTRAREWLAANKERAAKRRAEYYRENPEVFHNSRIKRRLRYEGKGLSRGLATLLLAEQGHKCPGCLCSLADGFHLDHVMPLAKGGKHCDDNIQALCPSCNLKKHDALPEAWFSRLLQNPQIRSIGSKSSSSMPLENPSSLPDAPRPLS